METKRKNAIDINNKTSHYLSKLVVGYEINSSHY